MAGSSRGPGEQVGLLLRLEPRRSSVCEGQRERPSCEQVHATTAGHRRMNYSCAQSPP